MLPVLALYYYATEDLQGLEVLLQHFFSAINYNHVTECFNLLKSMTKYRQHLPTSQIAGKTDTFSLVAEDIYS